ncbi:type III secretion system inner membrane ring lipoprotein SctJ [Desulfospira joergensenii]|uniref:type III secretion system inner membrane ring lipoprotein SctJ n=1 Tax=Desulfospira joergensenii TaxID=53329 RepID=UPI0003F8D123|nr:type III secretion inner membrane ring lipoprotein SctJ [Desulfospira joergensenii]
MAAVLFLLAGCQQELYKDLSERDTNEMMAALMKRGIYATKDDQGKGLFTLFVDESQVVGSLEILRRQSLPPQEFASLGSTFPKEGMMSSPLEEEARLGFAISQELAGTCAELDGVLNARVHVVLQEQDPVTEAITPATTSVFLRYLPGSSVEQYVPHIRNLAANAVPNLKYDNTYVFLFPASDTIIMPPPPEYKQLFGVDMAPYAVRTFITALVVFISLGVLTGAGCAVGYQKYDAYKKRAAEKEDEDDR